MPLPLPRQWRALRPELTAKGHETYSYPGSTARARVSRLGRTSLRTSSHLLASEYSKLVNPVILPPGRASLSTKPPSTGSETFANTIGTVRVASLSATRTGVPIASIAAGFVRANSAACARMPARSSPAKRMSSRTLLPSIRPKFLRDSLNARIRISPSVLLIAPPSTATIGIAAGCGWR